MASKSIRDPVIGFVMPQSPCEVVFAFSDQLDNIYFVLLRLVLYGLNVSKKIVKKAKKFQDLFDILEKKTSPGVAAALTDHVLKRFILEKKTSPGVAADHVLKIFRYNEPTGLGPFVDPLFDIRNYREVDLRLTVAGFFFSLDKVILSNVFLDLSKDYLKDHSKDEMKSVTRVVQMLCSGSRRHKSHRVITTDNILPLEQLARRYSPGYFNEYWQRYRPGEIGFFHY
jgi:hypothetical protein